MNKIEVHQIPIQEPDHMNLPTGDPEQENIIVTPAGPDQAGTILRVTVNLALIQGQPITGVVVILHALAAIQDPPVPLVQAATQSPPVLLAPQVVAPEVTHPAAVLVAAATQGLPAAHVAAVTAEAPAQVQEAAATAGAQVPAQGQVVAPVEVQARGQDQAAQEAEEDKNTNLLRFLKITI